MRIAIDRGSSGWVGRGGAWMPGCLLVLGCVLAAGCPETPPEEIADAHIVRRDAFSFDADLDADVDADVDASPLGLDAFRLLTDAGPVDAGPIPQCEGLEPPAVPCSNDDECRGAGLSYCRLPVVGNTCRPCMGLLNECETDLDCVRLATTDAGPEFLEDAAFDDAGDDAAIEDAGVVGPDAGGVRDTCVTYGPTCACPRRVCEPRCVGAACPDSQCDTDGYVCPVNSTCAPGAAVTDDHGCAPKACASNDDCDCGFCAPSGFCANGAGTCEA